MDIISLLEFGIQAVLAAVREAAKNPDTSEEEKSSATSRILKR